MKIRLLTILIFITHFCFAQNSKRLIEQSIHLIRNDENSKFEKTYTRIWNEYLKENVSFYSGVIDAIGNKEYAKAFQNIDSLISEDYFLDDILIDKNFSKLRQQKEWKVLEKRIKTIKSNYNNKVRRKLIAMRNKDQSIRLVLLEARKSNDSTLTKTVHSKMKRIDEESAAIVAKIIEKFGWLGADKIGSEANQTLFLGIQHIDDLIVQNKYLPILKEAVKKGNAEPWHLAYLTDRILMNQGKKQIYGTQIIVSQNSENSYVVPLQNPEKVDELRCEIGLGLLNDYLEEEGLSWNIEEYKKNLPRIEQLYKEWHEKQRN